MTAPRWANERAPLVLETPALPIVATFFSPMSRRRARRNDVYLEMRNPSGRSYLVTLDNGIERSHADDIYIATCIFDAFGLWYLTWHGIEGDDQERVEPIPVEVYMPRDSEG